MGSKKRLPQMAGGSASALSCVDGALRSSTMFGMATIAVGCSHVSGLLVQPILHDCWP
jgi:hypothetical protein